MSAPEYVGCSWVDDRHLAGEGRVAGVTFTGDSARLVEALQNSSYNFQVFQMSMQRVAKVAQQTKLRMDQVAKAHDDSE